MSKVYEVMQEEREIDFADSIGYEESKIDNLKERIMRLRNAGSSPSKSFKLRILEKRLENLEGGETYDEEM